MDNPLPNFINNRIPFNVPPAYKQIMAYSAPDFANDNKKQKINKPFQNPVSTNTINNDKSPAKPTGNYASAVFFSN